MTRDELIRNISGGDEYSFDDLPKEFLDKELLMEWLHGAGGALSEVPKHLVDDEIRRHAIDRDHSEMDVHQYPLKSISMAETQCYEELVLLALERCEWNMEHVDPALHSEAFFLKALDVNSNSLLFFLSGWTKARIDWTEAMIDSAVSKSLEYLPSFERSQVKTESLKHLISEDRYNPIEISNAGLVDVMSEMMGEGYWPHRVEKPSSIEDALHLILDSDDDRLVVYYTAYVLRHPIKDVLPLMKSPELQDLMLKLYTTEQLMPHLRSGLLKGAGRAKGKLLEDGLGL